MYAPMLTGKSGSSKHWAVRSCVALLCMASAVHTRVGGLCEKGQWADILAVAWAGVARPPFGRRCVGEWVRARRVS